MRLIAPAALAFVSGAVLGLVGVAQGALFAAATSGKGWVAFAATLLLGGGIWLAFTFGAYRGLSASSKPLA